MMFRSVFDHKTGNILKIGHNDLIMRGYHGFRRLSNAELKAAYGSQPRIPDYGVLSHDSPDFSNFHEFYGAALIPLIA